MARIIRLTERDLTRIVRRVIKEEVIDPIKLGFSQNGNGYILKLLGGLINIKIINKISEDEFLVHVYVNNVSEETIKNLKAFSDVSLILDTPFKLNPRDKYVSSSGEINGVDLEKIVNLLKSLSSDDLKLTERDLTRLVKRTITERDLTRIVRRVINEGITITDEDFPFPDNPKELNKFHVEEIFKVANSADEATEMIKDYYPNYYFEEQKDMGYGKTMAFMSPEGEEIAGKYIIGCCGGRGNFENMDRFKRSDDAFYDPRNRY